MQLINTFYVPADRENNLPDNILLVLKDPKTQEKQIVIKPKPTLDFHITKDPNDTRYHNFIKAEDTIPVRVYYNDLYKSIVRVLNDEKVLQEYKNILASKTQIGQKLREMHLHPRLHGSDMNIQDHYMSRYIAKYPQDEYLKQNPLHKMVYDIEVDLENISGFPDPSKAEAPINIITAVDMLNLKCYTYCLKYEHETYVNTFNEMDRIKKELDEKYEEVLKGRKMEFIVEEYEDELDMIKAYFSMIHEVKPDFISAWNANGFDNPYLMNRCVQLGEEPENIMCPPEAPIKKVKYYYDARNSDPADNNSSFSVTGYSVFVDAMNIFANIRKTQGKEESYTLDYIGEKYTGMTKDEQLESFKTFHISDYEKFFKYNIQDTVMLMVLEEKNRDIDNLFLLSMITNTRIESVMKKTISLRNLAERYANKIGYIMSNNHAKLKRKIEGKIPGALTLYKRTLNLFNCWKTLVY